MRGVTDEQRRLLELADAVGVELLIKIAQDILTGGMVTPAALIACALVRRKLDQAPEAREVPVAVTVTVTANPAPPPRPADPVPDKLHL